MAGLLGRRCMLVGVVMALLMASDGRAAAAELMIREEPELRNSIGMTRRMYADGGSDEAHLVGGGLDVPDTAVELAAEAPAPSSAACSRLPWMMWVVVGLASSMGPFLG
ncbi:unnamed protein product [Spirodela intermedia]|uniref:Uncharacterized protein n=2 Tax=Spirodela intermedia TaxID=51605 RepID=A0A7I8LIP1_SPIIN|nr:unnamed protein product [Spirodela intermedia]CAA6672364.1 unnamed protein product [Spirodela intermedia]CAA7409546.1 unnamed protein product [Spirodela intermedia]